MTAWQYNYKPGRKNRNYKLKIMIQIARSISLESGHEMKNYVRFIVYSYNQTKI